MTTVEEHLAAIARRTHRYRRRKTWERSRVPCIGCSEVAGMLGLSIYKDATPFRMWQRHVPDATAGGAPEFQGTQAMRWGTRLEGAILSAYADNHLEARVEPRRLAVTHHAEFPVLRGTPDALVRTKDGGLLYGLDAKSVPYGGKHWGEPGSDDLPPDALIQGLLYCAIFDAPFWDFAVLVRGADYREYRVHRSESTEIAIISRALDWWDRYVVAKRYPPMDSSDAATEFLQRIYPRDERPLLPPGDEAARWAAQSFQARQAVGEAKKQQVAADNALRELIGDAEGIEGIATWRQSKPSQRTHWEAVARDLAAHLRRHYAVQDAADVLERFRSDYTTTKPGPRVFRFTYHGDQSQ